MKRWKSLGMVFLLSGLVAAQPIPDDPVLKARSQRAQSQGISEGDLPPVPKGITEPPPLPPPESHVKDTKGYHPKRKGAASRRKSGKSTHAKGKTPRKRSKGKK